MVLVSLVGSAFVATVVLVILVSRELHGLTNKGSLPSRSRLFHLAFPFWVTNAVLLVLVQADIWIVGASASTDSLALYAAAFRLAPFGLVVTSLLYWTLPPFLIERFTVNDRAGMENLLRGAATLSTLLTLPLLIPMLLAPGLLLRAVYGPFYEQAAPVLMVLTFGVAVQVATGMRGYVLMLTGHQWQQMGITLIAAALNVAGGLIAAETVGPIGVAAVSAGAVTIQVIAELVYVRRSLGIWTHFSPTHLVRLIRFRGAKRVGVP
jgi:O-antigen/teichoic acid export membrane protein